jgi:hypothetical protein
LKRHTDTLKSWGRLLTNETVDLSGDVAHVESYITRLASRRKDARSDIIAVRYIDRVERRKGEWRIAMREVIPYFLTETDTALDAYIQESSYSGLGQARSVLSPAAGDSSR